jgi:hypothetical protein
LDLTASVPLERVSSPSADTDVAGLPPLTGETAPISRFASWLPDRGAPAPAAPEVDPNVTTAEGQLVRTEIGMRHGVDLSTVPVDRGPAAQAEARVMRARGYTGPSEIVIPAEIGSLDSGPGAALLAHELTHVAQRARLGAEMPAENTPAGHRLEVEALTAELALAPPGLGTLPRQSAAATRSTAPRGRSDRSAGPPVPPTGEALPVAAPRSGGVDQETLAAMLGEMSARADATANQTVTYLPGGVSYISAGAAPAPAAAAPVGVQRAEEVPEQNIQSAVPQANEAVGQGESSLWASRPGDEDLEKMARWLYPLISFRIRAELREGRERSGMLTDSYGRW